MQKAPLKVALFTDIHLDYDYLVGAKNDKCGRIICCRADSGEAENEEQKAGFWGSQHCDGNENLLASLLEFLKTSVKPDFALWGGDNVGHNSDSMTK